MMLKMILIVVAVLAVAAAVYFLLIRGDSSAETTFQVKQIQSVAFTGDLVVSINSTGQIQPIQTVEIKSKASGEIIELNVDVGDFVHRGDLICRLDNRTALNDYKQADADYDVAQASVGQKEREYNRQKALFEKKLISEKELDDAALAYETAKSTLVRTESNRASLKERLDDTEVRAPLDGLVLRRTVEKGQIISSGVSNVSGGTLICQVAQMDSVYVIADVDETDIGKIEIGQKVNVTADAFPDSRFEGKVQKISPISKTEQNVTIFEVTTIIDNSQGLLKAGMNCSVEIITAEAYGAVLVPNDAVKDPKSLGMGGEVMQNGQRIPVDSTRRPDQRGREQAAQTGQPGMAGKPIPGSHGSRNKVVMIKRNGTFEPEMVAIGKANLDFTQILSGIAPGDTVDATPVSLMMQDRATMRERMRNWQSIPGMRRQ